MSASEARWPMFRRVERRARRTRDMMERLSVDPLALARLRQGEAYAEVRRRCLACSSSKKCLAWMEEDHQHESLPEFCPNLRLFLRFRRSGSADD